MAKYMMVVTSSSKPGQEAAYGDWYDNVHIKDICKLNGVKSGKRLVASPEVSPNPPPGGQLAIYEIETDDVGKVLEEMTQRVMSGEFGMTDTIDAESAQIWFYQPA